MSIANGSVVDISCLPFTPNVKAGPYQDPSLKGSLEKLGAWDHPFSATELVEAMDASGVEIALIPAQMAGAWEVPYEVVVDELTSRYPDRLFGMAGIDPRRITRGVQKIERAVRDLGFVGAHLYPHWYGLPPDDRQFYPFYAKCCELDIPVQIQVGLAFQTDLRSVGRPGAIDTIAVDFPELRIVGIHTGYPWEREMVAVAWKHANVYVGADTHHPRTWSTDLIDFIRGDGREKVVFGTNYPCLAFADALAGVEELVLGEAMEMLLSGNARRIYGLP